MNKPWVVHVVDDDEPVRTAFVYALQAVGFVAVGYVDANDFLGQAREERGVLISDVRMPGMSGIELTHYLRQHGSKMPIMLMTGHADGEIQNDAMNAGADRVLAKPLALPAVVAEIAMLTTDWV